MRKMEHDLARMESSPQDQYAAFDFFVTAEHLVDWIYPKDTAGRRALRTSTVLLRITSHIENGAKHFEATAKHHNSVSEIEVDRYVKEGYVKDIFENR